MLLPFFLLASCSGGGDGEKGYENIREYLQDGYWVEDSVLGELEDKEHRTLKIFDFENDSNCHVNTYVFRWDEVYSKQLDNYEVTDSSFLFGSDEEFPPIENWGRYRWDTINKGRIRFEATFEASLSSPDQDSVMYWERIEDVDRYLDSLSSQNNGSLKSCKVRKEHLQGLWRYDSISRTHYTHIIGEHLVGPRYIFFDGNGQTYRYDLSDEEPKIDSTSYEWRLDRLTMDSKSMEVICLDSGKMVMENKNRSLRILSHFSKVNADAVLPEHLMP